MKIPFVRGVLLLALIGLTFLAPLSCARTVTDLTPIFEVQFQITFRGPVDPTKYNYYLIFSTSTSPITQVQPPPDDYFPTPGRPFDTTSPYVTQYSNGITHYYQTYFSSWSDYLIFNKDCPNNIPTFYRSNATNFDPNTTLQGNIGNYAPYQNFQPTLFTVNGNVLTIRFSTQTFSNPNPTTLHFTFVTSRYGTNSGDQGTGTVIDVLNNQNPSVTIQTQNFAGTPDQEGDVSDAGADITSWRVQVF